MPASLGKICIALCCALFGAAITPLPAPAQNLIVDSFANASSVALGKNPGLVSVNYRGYDVTVEWDPNQASPGNPNPGAMYVTVDWPGPSDPDYTTAWTDMQFDFSTAGMSADETFNSSNYITFECDIKVDVTNSYTALDGTYGRIELIVNDPWEPLVDGAPLAATNGWQHFTGHFSAIPGGDYEQAIVGLVSSGTGTLTNTVSYWIDNIVFTAVPTSVTIVDSFENASSVGIGQTPGLDYVNKRGYDVTVAWDPNQASPENPNSGAMYVTVNWPGPSDPDYTTAWTDMLFQFSTAGIAAGGIFNSSDYVAFGCDVKVDVTNSYTALDGTYGKIELIVNDPYTSLVEDAPLAATNGWQHFTGYFSAIPAGDYKEAIVGLLSDGTGTLTNTVSYWIDNVVFTELPTITITSQPENTTGAPGGVAQFNVAAEASYFEGTSGGVIPQISYQWQSAPAGSAVFTNIPYATNLYYIKTALTLADNGAQFQVVVAAGGLSATSSIATLSVVQIQAVPVPVLTFHYDNARSGANTNEAFLTPANVANTNTFGLLFSCPVDGYVYAQPLLLTNVAIPGMGSHNVVYIVTEHDSVYAFDADSNSGSNASPLWHTSFLNPLAGVTNVSAAAFSSASVVGPEVGITAVPVIDPTNGTIYVVAYTTEVSQGVTNYVHRLHALDVSTGNEQPGSPVQVICTNYPGTGDPAINDNDGHGHVGWNGATLFNRPALLFNAGVVYVTMGSHVDALPGHGWVLAYDASSLAQVGTFNTSPNGAQAGLWMGGGGPAADGEGNIYFMTANGTFKTNYPSASSYSLGESFIKLATANGLSLADYFTPSNQATLSAHDIDLGMGGVLLLPDSAGSVAHPHLMVGGGKEGVLYLVDRDNLGHFNAASDQVVQKLISNGLNESAEALGILTPTYFNNCLYYVEFEDVLKAFAVTNGSLSTSPVSASTAVDYTSGSAVISALGTNNAIVWQVLENAVASSGPAVLHAFDAYNLAHEFYNSSMAGNRDTAGAAIKYASPVVCQRQGLCRLPVHVERVWQRRLFDRSHNQSRRRLLHQLGDSDDGRHDTGRFLVLYAGRNRSHHQLADLQWTVFVDQ
jgi:hypothetical protein